MCTASRLVSHLDVEVLPEGGVVDGSVVHNAQTVTFTPLAGPHLACPGLQPPFTSLTVTD